MKMIQEIRAGAVVATITEPIVMTVNDTTTGALYYDADGSGGGAAIKFAILGLDTHPSITYKDFFIVG
ncbi:MAG: hypothetical protein KGZ82_09495 [Bacteroidales bacterium]|nr:hypothetical protein [Bacteroidales bacterium]